MIFRRYAVYKGMIMVKIRDQAREKLQILSQVLE